MKYFAFVAIAAASLLVAEDLAKHISTPPSFLENVRGMITPGTTLVLANTPVNGQTESAPGFNILTTAR